jgi:hypothetical protein
VRPTSALLPTCVREPSEPNHTQKRKDLPVEVAVVLLKLLITDSNGQDCGPEIGGPVTPLIGKTLGEACFDRSRQEEPSCKIERQ